MLTCCTRSKCKAIIITKPVLHEDKEQCNANTPPLPSFSLGEKLESVYPLLDLIFTYLNYKDLLQCSAVRSTWREIALKELKSRQELAWFSSTGEKQLYELKRSPNLLRSNPCFCIALLRTSKFSLNTQICVKYEDHHSCCKVSDYLLKNICGHPFRETLVLGSKDISSHVDVTQKAVTCKKEISLLEGFTIPQIPETRIILIQIDAASTGVKKEQYVKSSESVNCLLIFCDVSEKRGVNNLVECLLEGQDPKEVPIAGGAIFGSKTYFVGSQMRSETRSSNYGISCIAFLHSRNEERNLLSYSIVLTDEICLIEEFKEKLLKFKERITMRSQSAAFRFSCSCKQSKRQEEVVAFNSIFPNTPLLGLDVFGEIGWDTVIFPDEDVKRTKRKKLRSSKLPPIFHEWSTTILLITWSK